LNDLTVQQFMYKSEGYGEKSGCEMLDYEFTYTMLALVSVGEMQQHGVICKMLAYGII